MTRPSPIVPVSRATKHVMDAQGQWTVEQRIIWRDANGWHDIPARESETPTRKEANNGTPHHESL
jgi:hypothetical protein